MFTIFGQPGPNDHKLGCKAENINWRLNYFKTLRGGDGFGRAAKQSNGKRADRKAERRELFLSRFREPQAAKYRHSSATVQD